MVFSNLFSDDFIHQVQVVGYLHEWSPIDKMTGGDFVYFNHPYEIGVVNPQPRSGSLIDGTKVFHAAKIFQPHRKAPHLAKDKDSSLRFLGNDSWIVQSNGEVIERYCTSDLRMSIVYRARCFKDAQQASDYFNLPETDMITLDEVLKRLTDELIVRKILTPERLLAMSRLDLAMFLIDSYIVYPLPSRQMTWFPYNYCALSKLFPWVQNLLQFIC